MRFRLLDTLANLVSGLGTSKDKAFSDSFVLSMLDRASLDAAYRGDWIARKIVDVPPFDETREGRDWQAEGADIEKIEAEEKRLGFWRKLARARRLARLHGGSVIIMGAGGSSPQNELRPDTIKSGGLRYIHVLSRFEVSTGQVNRDVTDPFFGEPEYYEVNSAATQGRARIHPSRVIRFIGADLPDWSLAPDCWGDSVLQAVQDAVKHAGLAAQGIASLIHEAKIDVIRIPGLAQNLASEGYSERLVQRFTLSNTLKSINNTLVLDKEEEWDRKTTAFNTLPEILDRYLQVAAGAADIPATRLIGIAPQGMNSTGDGDYKNYLDRIKAGQELELRPAIEPLDELLIRSALGSRPEDVHYTWAPLWRMSEKELAEVNGKNAETAAKYADSGLVPLDALSKGVTNKLIEDGVFPGFEVAMEESTMEAEALLKPEEVEPGEEDIEGDDPDADPALKGKPTVPKKKRVADAQPRTLYVRRDLINSDDLVAWAKEQGFTSTVDDMHVTIAFSRTPLDWMKVGESWSFGNSKGQLEVGPGGARIVEKLGENATVLLFASSELSWRHMAIRDAGASWDHAEYQPHVTITYEGAPDDLDSVEPYRGKLVFGPEIFEEVDEDWKARLTEA